MSLSFPTTALKKPSGLKATSGIKRPAFGALYGFDSSGGDSGGGFTNQYSVSLDGSDDELTIPQGTFNLGSGVFSFSLWFNADSLNAYNTFFNISSSNTLKLATFMSSGGDIYCSNWNYNNIIASSNTINTGTWYHVAFVKSTAGNAGVFKLYLNGNPLTTNTNTMNQGSDFGSEDSTSTIGKTYNASSPHPFDGKIDEFSFWNSALSASQISDIYNSGVPNDISSLSPVGWWRMGDNNSGSGTTITDQGSGGNDGTLTNGPTFSTSVPEYVFNQYSVSFDASDDYMSIPDADIFSLGNGSGTDNAFSISGWFNADNIHTNYIATKDYSTDREWAFRTVTNQLHFFAFGTGGGYIGRKYTTNLSGGQWYHAVVTYDGSKASSGIKLYLDGSRVDDADYAGGTYTAAVNTSEEIRVSALHRNNTYSGGKVDELSFFNTELSASDVTSIYNSGSPADISSLNPVGWWRMGDNNGASGTTITDQGSGGNNGTLTNGPTFSTSVPT